MTTLSQLVIATNNTGKYREFDAALGDDYTVIPQSQWSVSSVDETGLSYIENAILKARHAAKICGLPVLADDSGLSVDILDGAPGIYSARYAGENARDQDNITKLLNSLQNVAPEKRQASFHCVLAIVQHANDPCPQIFTGQWSGFISQKAHGIDGFGYDPIFFIPDRACTAAELPAEIKQQISHRGIAVQKLLTSLRER